MSPIIQMRQFRIRPSDEPILKRLAPEQRTVLELRETSFDDKFLSLETIALMCSEIEGRPVAVGTVKSRLHRARVQILAWRAQQQETT